MAQQAGSKVARPLSPHLQVYKWRVHLLVSIMHRATGSALMVGAMLLTWFLVALATGSDYFNTVMGYAGSIPGRIVLFGITLALMQHMASGVRHLFMDAGALYDLKTNTATATFTLVFTVVSTLIIWYAAYAVMGQA